MAMATVVVAMMLARAMARPFYIFIFGLGRRWRGDRLSGFGLER
jgi:hypothetical protein